MELENAKKFVKFQEQLEKSSFTAVYPPKVEEIDDKKFEVDIDKILGIPENKYKTEFQKNFQQIPTMKPPTEISGSVVDLGNRIKIDGKVFNVK